MSSEKKKDRRQILEERHYPINWEISDGEICITDYYNKKLSKDHDVYQHELSFIKEEISSMRFSGEICCM